MCIWIIFFLLFSDPFYFSDQCITEVLLFDTVSVNTVFYCHVINSLNIVPSERSLCTVMEYFCMKEY